MWPLPPLHASELCLFSDSGVQHVHFVAKSFMLLSVSSFQSLLVFDAPSLKWKLDVWKVWSQWSGSGQHPFSTHLNTSHLELGPDSGLPKLADSWLLPVPSGLRLGYLFSSRLQVWSRSASSSETPQFFFSSDFIRVSSSSLGSSDLK